VSDTSPNSLAGPKILLQGDSGSGKTYALATIVNWAARQNPPRQVFVLFTENGLEALLGWWRTPPEDPQTGKPIRPAAPVPDNLHWHILRNLTIDLVGMKNAAQQAGTLSYQALANVVDPSRGTANPAYKVLEACENFPDDRTGQKFGNIGSWGPERILCIDSLSELGQAYIKMCIGNKPVMAQNEYQVAQNNLMNFLRYQTQAGLFTFVMTAHLQKQANELTGAMTQMTKAIGKAMSDDIPQLFSEVIYCYREGAQFWWDTTPVGVLTKTRYLPLRAKIPPDLGFIMDKWLERSKA